MTHYQLQGKNPTAIITRSRSELKVYENNSIYLNNGDTFEVRLFNPLQEKISCEIIFNGVQRSTSKIILRPGEDVTIERFLDDNKKMKFDTYQIDGDNKSAVKATEKNGLIEIKFYHEKQVYCGTTITTLGCNPPYTTYTTYPKWTTDIQYYGSNIGQMSNFTSSVNLDDSVNFDYNSGTFNTSGTNKKFDLPKKRFKKSLETGRVEKGEKSNQEFQTTEFTSQLLPFCTISYNLKPNSVKPQTINEIRNYCTSCGYRLRKSTWKFCPSCGSES